MTGTARRPAGALLVGGSVPATVVGLLAVAVAALAGRPALLGAVAGWAVAVLALAAVPGVQLAARRCPDELLPAVAVGTHVLVVSLVGLAAWWLTGQPEVDDLWFVGAAAGSIVGWVLGAGRAALRARVAVYDQPEPDRGV